MWSNKYLHIPFVEKGRLETGADCWGLARIIYLKELGVQLPSFDEYTDTEDVESISQMIKDNQQASQWKLVEPGQEEMFDIVVFRMMGAVMHIGVVAKQGWMIHCQRGINTAHDEYLQNRNWKGRLEGIYRYAGNSDNPSTV